VKTVADIYSPVEGTVVEVNSTLEDDADVLNTDPYGEGWIFKVDINQLPEMLLTPEEYTKLIAG